MGIFSGLKQRIADRLGNMIFGQSHKRWWDFTHQNRRDYGLEIQKHGGVGTASVVMAPVMWIMRTLPEAPVVLADSDGERTNEHPMMSLLHRPNGYYSGRMMWMAIANNLSIDGNAYLVKVRDGQLRVRELWYVPYWLIEPHYPQDGSQFIDYYEYKPNGELIKLDPSDVIHFRWGIDPANMRKGLSQLKAALREVYSDMEAASFAASMLANGGVPGLIITPKDETTAKSPAFSENIKDYVRHKFTGENRGEPLAFSAPADVQTFGFDPKSMDLSAVRNLSEERVCAMLGIQPSVVGFGTGLQQTKVGATAKEAREMSYEHGIIPLLRLIEDELHVQLLPDFEPDPSAWTVEHDLSNVRVLQEDQTELINRLNTAVQGGWLTVAEAQRRAGWEADESQEAYLRPVNLVTTPAGTEGKHLPVESRKYVKQDEEGGVENSGASEAGIKFIQTMNKRRPEIEDEWITEQVKRFEDLGEQVSRLWLEQSQKSRKTLEDEVNAEKALDNMNWEEAKERALAYEALYLSIAKETFEQGNALLGLAVNLTDEREAAVLGEAGIRKGLIELREQTKMAMFKAIKEGREAGEGVDVIARRIRDDIPAGPWSSARVRSEVIARTEGRYAQNISTLEMGKEAGAQAFRVIDAQIPGDRPHSDEAGIVCSAINGEIVSADDVGYLSSVEHPNGTRDFIPVFDPEAEPRSPQEFSGR